MDLTAAPGHPADGPDVTLLPRRGACRCSMDRASAMQWATVYEIEVLSGEDPPTCACWVQLTTVDGQIGWILCETWCRSVEDDATTRGESG